MYVCTCMYECMYMYALVYYDGVPGTWAWHGMVALPGLLSKMCNYSVQGASILRFALGNNRVCYLVSLDCFDRERL